MLNCISGVFDIDIGKISIGGIDITRAPEHKRAAYNRQSIQDPLMGRPLI
jgi:putative ABC transport system ATP-binding protein